MIVQEDICKKLSNTNPELKRFALKLTCNNIDAEDLYQETILRIIINISKFTPETNYKAWASTIMKNIFINNYRKKKRRRKTIDYKTNRLFIDSILFSKNNEALSKLECEEILNMIEQLPEKLKHPFIMALEGYKYEEIAKHTNSPVGTIKSRIFSTKKQLQLMYINANGSRN